MQGKELPKEIQKEIENEQRIKYLSDVRVKSYFGAIAAFFVLQIFGSILYYAFRAYSSSFSILFPGFYLVGFLYVQIDILVLIKNFLAEKKIPELKNASFRTIVKLIIGGLALIIFILFKIGYYPFPKNNTSDLLGEILFQLLILAISWVIANNRKWKKVYITRVGTQTGSKRLFAMIFSLLMFFMTLSRPELFYIFSIIPLGAFFVLFTSWLVENDSIVSTKTGSNPSTGSGQANKNIWR